MVDQRNKIELVIKARKEKYRREATKGSFKSYCMYWDPLFFSKRKKLDDVINAFQFVYDAYKNKNQVRIAISTPPRAGKSYTTSLFCSFMLGHFPKESIMRNTCTSTLRDKLMKDVGNMLSSNKWKECFETNNSLVINNSTQVSLETATQISCFGAGVGGTIIGLGASMLAITDDVFNKMEDALSGIKNERVVSWDESAMGSRLEGNCCRIDIGTRWTKDDIIGRNINRYDLIVKISALDENGESNFPNVQSTKQYISTKKSISGMTWNAEYMQEPMDIKGQLFKASELMFFDSIVGEVESNIAVCDTADTGTDYLSSPMVKKVGELYYLYDVVFTQLNMDFSAPMVETAYTDNKVQIARFESNNGGKLFAKDIEKRVPSCAFYWKQTTSNKETRILTDFYWIKKHVVFRYPYDKEFHPEGYREGSDYDLFMKQMTSYVKGKNDQHDDAPDSLSMLRHMIDDIGYEDRKGISDGEEWPSCDIGIEQIRI